VRQNPIQRTVKSVHMCVHRTVHNCDTRQVAPLNFARGGEVCCRRLSCVLLRVSCNVFRTSWNGLWTFKISWKIVVAARI